MKLKLTALSRTYYFLLPLLATTCMLVSCSKQETQQQPSTDYDLRISSYKGTDVKLVFRLLTATEKCAAWKSHFDQYMKIKNLNTAQRQFIDELKRFITPSLFSTPITAKLDNELSGIKGTALGLFSEMDAVQLLTSLEVFENKQEDNCGCSRANDWCNGLLICRNAACRETSGCGIFGLYDCNGTCQ